MLKFIKLEYCFARFTNFKHTITDLAYDIYLCATHRLRGDISYSKAIQIYIREKNMYTYYYFMKDLFPDLIIAQTIEIKLRDFELC